MFACTTQGTPEHPVIKLAGSLTLEHSKEIHVELVARLPQAGALTIDLENSEKSDLSFVQILCSLLTNQSTRISFVSLPTHLLELAASLGADSLIKEITSRIEDTV
ncbi:STAS domain-containing protein [Desulfomicrobium sp. ZS1]|uniref:STAS domain-containing protein n=1 Tax=Desulfomicrobium sp. ZS1 TaxID=2952228 RepID=UPI0020B314A1|nr:STAS domain-containing protein [Desulfomicrobium sp. ZS1]UTF51836.1 STAS domain-containing protein [Desulfomicrobium sp. ZS1]